MSGKATMHERDASLVEPRRRARKGRTGDVGEAQENDTRFEKMYESANFNGVRFENLGKKRKNLGRECLATNAHK